MDMSVQGVQGEAFSRDRLHKEFQSVQSVVDTRHLGWILPTLCFNNGQIGSASCALLSSSYALLCPSLILFARAMPSLVQIKICIIPGQAL